MATARKEPLPCPADPKLPVLDPQAALDRVTWWVNEDPFEQGCVLRFTDPRAG